MAVSCSARAISPESGSEDDENQGPVRSGLHYSNLDALAGLLAAWSIALYPRRSWRCLGVSLVAASAEMSAGRYDAS